METESMMAKTYAGIGSGGIATGSQLGYAGDGKTATPPQPAIAGLYQAIQHLREAAELARSTTDNLCGSQPEAIGKEAGPSSSSLFGQMEDITAEVHAMSSRIMSDMRRIQNKL